MGDDLSYQINVLLILPTLLRGYAEKPTLLSILLAPVILSLFLVYNFVLPSHLIC